MNRPRRGRLESEFLVEFAHKNRPFHGSIVNLMLNLRAISPKNGLIRAE